MTPRPHIRSDYTETRRNKRNVHYLVLLTQGPERGGYWASWMPIAEWVRTVETLPAVVPVEIRAQAGEALTAGSIVAFGPDGKLYNAKAEKSE